MNSYIPKTEYEEATLNALKEMRAYAIIEKIPENTRLIIILAIIGIGLLLVIGTTIIVNQIRIRKQLRQIQEQLAQKENKDVN